MDNGARADHDDAASVEVDVMGAAGPAVVEFTSFAQLACPVYTPSLLSWLAHGLVVVVLPLYILEMGGTYTEVGALSSLSGVTMVLSNVPAGAILQRWGPKATLLCSCVLLAVAPLTCLAFPTIPGVGAAYLFLGAAKNTSIISRQMIISACIAPGLRGRISSSFGGIQRISFFGGPFIAGAILQFARAEAVFVLQLLLAVASGVATRVFLPHIRATQSLDLPTGGSGPKLREEKHSVWSVAMAHKRNLFVLTVFVGCMITLRRGRELFFALCGHELKLSQSMVGYVTGISYLVDAVMFPVGGISLDFAGRTRTGCASCVVFSVGCLMLLFDKFWALVVFGVVSGVANGVSAGIVLTIGADLAPAEARGTFLAVFRFLSNIAEFLAPVGVGAVSERFSLRSSEMSMALLSVLGALWALLCIPETLDRGRGAKAGAPQRAQHGGGGCGSKAILPGIIPVKLGRSPQYHKFDKAAGGDEDGALPDGMRAGAEDGPARRGGPPPAP